MVRVTLGNFKQVGKKGAGFCLALIKVQCDEGRGRILLGDDTCGRVVMQWPIRYRCVGTGYPVDYLECLPTNTVGLTYSMHLAHMFSWSQTCHSVFTPITVFWNVEPCSLLGNYRRFEGNRCFCHEDRGSMFLRSGDNYL